jgi:hypothetical protein
MSLVCLLGAGKHITEEGRDSNISGHFRLENDMSEPTFTLFLLIVLLYLVKS